jgi:uncharacterized protein (TIGR02391 family)
MPASSRQTAASTSTNESVRRTALRELLIKLPTPDSLLSCTPSQLDGILLAAIGDRVKRSESDPIAPRNISLGELQGIYPAGDRVTFAQRQAADAALTESWRRILNDGFLMEAVGQAAGVMTLTMKGRQAADATCFEEIKVRQMLRREMLHPDLQGSVYDAFAAGHYDTAVLEAFKLVEDAVRNASGLGANLVGVRLMRDAFNSQNGPLRDPTLPQGEQDRMPDLFAGAIGVFKNPLSHRKVGNADPAPVSEELMFASRLMRLVKP